MNATEARSITKKAEAASMAAKIAEGKRIAKRDALERAKALNNDYPKFMSKARAEITKVASGGRKSVDIYFNNTKGDWAVAYKAVDTLRADGFSASIESWEDDHDYGDFNAPCVVHEYHQLIRVSW